MSRGSLLRLIVFVIFILCPCLWGADPAPPADPKASAKADRWLVYAQALRAQVMTADACPFDPTAVVIRTGDNPDKLSAFVRDQIAWEPYSGIQRGADGALACGAGNDWDRALLLRALLKEAGYQSTLKVIPRTDAQIAAVVDAFLAHKPNVLSLCDLSDPDLNKLPPPNPLLAQFNIPPENRLIHLQQSAAAWRSQIGACLDAADAQAPVIAAALDSAKSPITGAPMENWRAPLLDGAKNRVVVQLTTADGLKTLSIGPDTDPPSDSALSAADAIDEIPADQKATIVLELAMKVGGDGASGDPVTILAKEIPLASLFRTSNRLEIVPSDKKAAASPASSWKPDTWFSNVSGFKSFQAIIHFGHDVAASPVFDLYGQLHEVSSDGQIAGAQELSAGGAFGGFGGALGGGGNSAPSTHLDQLTLNITLKIPGSAPIQYSRLIYGAPRTRMSPIFSADILAANGPLQPPTIQWLTLSALVADAPVVAAEIRAGGTMPPDSSDLTGNSEFVRLPQSLHDWQLGRLTLAGKIISGNDSLTVSPGPALIFRTEQITLDNDAKQVGWRSGIDVVFDQQKIIPREGNAIAAAVAANQRLGIASTVLESVLLARSEPDATDHGPYSVSQEALLLGEQPSVRPAGAASGNANPLAEWAVAQNEKGRLLVFTSAKDATVWWAIDPATGVTIGRGGGGEGQAAMEYLQITRMNMANLKCCLAFMQTFLNGNPEGFAAMACLAGLDNPGTYLSFAGTFMDTYEIMSDSAGLLAKFGDCLYGAWDATH